MIHPPRGRTPPAPCQLGLEAVPLRGHDGQVPPHGLDNLLYGHPRGHSGHGHTRVARGCSSLRQAGRGRVAEERPPDEGSGRLVLVRARLLLRQPEAPLGSGGGAGGLRQRVL